VKRGPTAPVHGSFRFGEVLRQRLDDLGIGTGGWCGNGKNETDDELGRIEFDGRQRESVDGGVWVI